MFFCTGRAAEQGITTARNTQISQCFLSRNTARNTEISTRFSVCEMRTCANISTCGNCYFEVSHWFPLLDTETDRFSKVFNSEINTCSDLLFNR